MIIDLRSDTVTKPTPEMRQAMFAAEVGDDVYQEDPTVNRLEERAAQIFGKEAALYVPTGTMGNTIAIKVHTHHGEEVVCDARSHILNYELAMLSWFAGCVPRAIPTEDGVLSWDRIQPEVRPLGPHWAPTGLIEIENSHNMAGGTVTPIEIVNDICDKAHERGIPVHMDGARVFNASACLGRPVAEITAKVDTVMFCLSKGLGAPVGSMLVGTREAIDKGRLYRKRLGGGMRQAGVLAAAGLIALEQMPHRLSDDHVNAKLLAEGLAKIPGISIDPAKVQTNIVIYDVSGTGLTAPEFVKQLRGRGINCGPVNDAKIRFVTHFDVSTDQCKAALGACEEVAAAVGKR
ncbi:MAG: low specificity L-threonine aldolase [Bryobacterales bacterium]|nr:low specificity L-threonine aldolase [Bryobacterales bacterium]